MTPVSDLEDHTGYWMRMVSNAVSQAFARKLAAEDVTVAEWSFLRCLLGLEPVAPSALADAMGMTRGAISKLADRLEAKGLVNRQENPADGRAHSLSLTSEGRQRVPVLAALADRNDAEFFNLLKPEDHARLKSLLKAVADGHGLRSTPLD